MQCFRVGYRGICHASLVFSAYTRAFRRKIADVVGTVRKRSRELESFGADFEKSSKGSQHNGCAQVMTGNQNGILPVAYYPLHTVEYARDFLASDLLYFL